MRVRFASIVDWTLQEDYLRCSSLFYGCSRHDGIIYRSTDTERACFARLLFVFACNIGESELGPVALVQPVDVLLDADNAFARKDRHLGSNRVRAQPRERCNR